MPASVNKFKKSASPSIGPLSPSTRPAEPIDMPPPLLVRSACRHCSSPDQCMPYALATVASWPKLPVGTLALLPSRTTPHRRRRGIWTHAAPTVVTKDGPMQLPSERALHEHHCYPMEPCASTVTASEAMPKHRSRCSPARVPPSVEPCRNAAAGGALHA